MYSIPPKTNSTSSAIVASIKSTSVTAAMASIGSKWVRWCSYMLSSAGPHLYSLRNYNDIFFLFGYKGPNWAAIGYFRSNQASLVLLRVAGFFLSK